MDMMFASRAEAGRRLGAQLLNLGIQAEVVLGLPRGGVVVAAEIAHALRIPLDVLVVRKIGHPLHREFAVGALAEPDVVVLDRSLLGVNPLTRFQLQQVISEETRRLKTYQGRFHTGERRPLTGQDVVIADDGLATGSTMEAAVLSARKQRAQNVVVAVPVASTHGVERIKSLANKLVVLCVDPDFEAVGRYYQSFGQTQDAEVLELLKN